MRGSRRTFFLSSLALFASASVCAQTFFWDFEGPNGLDGWYRSDGAPLQTSAGLASGTSVKVPSNNSPSPLFIYHEVPYNATSGYLATCWSRSLVANSAGWNLRFAWIVSGGQSYWGGNAVTGSNTTEAWIAMEHSDILTYNYGGTFAIIIEFSSSVPQDNWVDNVEVTILPANTPILSVQVLLGGNVAIDGTSMTDGLRATGQVPLAEPYSALGYPQFAGGGGETCIPGLFDASIFWPGVDWVRIELRSASNPSTIVATRQAVVDRYGNVRDHNGDTRLVFNVPMGDYHVAIRHRNHLGCMTAVPKTFAVWDYPPGEGVSFSTPATATWGIGARKIVGSTALLWPGDANGDGVIKYAGVNNDRDLVLQAIGGVVPTNTLNNVYDRRDLNLDGIVKYTGTGNDRDVILESIGGAVPTNTRVQQLP